MKIYKFDHFEISLYNNFIQVDGETNLEFFRTDNYFSESKIIVDKKNKICTISVDLVRTYPIFYYWKDGKWYVTDRLPILEYKNWEMDNFLKEEFSLTGYVTGDNTLLKDIYQVEAGTKVCLYSNGNKKVKRYFTYSTNENEILKEPLDFLKSRFKEILFDVFRELIKSLNNKTVVIPLSGGYDSRLIACMMKEMGYDNIICFTYGKADSFEVVTSREVASKLGYKWYFVEYTKDLFLQVVKTDLFNAYLDFAFNYVSLPVIQDFFALYYLTKNNLIPKDSIIIPGHTGDFFTGAHIYNVGYTTKKNRIAEEIFANHFILKESSKINDVFLNRIMSHLNDGLPWTIMEDWDLRNRQAKFIVNSLRVYEFFGYETRIPLWNFKLADFFRRIELKYKNRKTNYRLESNLYDSTVMEIFKIYSVDIKKNVSSFKIPAKLKLILKTIIRKNKIFNKLFLKIKGNQLIDVNNFKELSEVLGFSYNTLTNINTVLISYFEKKYMK